MELNEDLMNLLGKEITWNNERYKALSVSIEEDGVQVWGNDHTWYYLRNGEWLIYSELPESEEQ